MAAQSRASVAAYSVSSNAPIDASQSAAFSASSGKAPFSDNFRISAARDNGRFAIISAAFARIFDSPADSRRRFNVSASSSSPARSPKLSSSFSVTFKQVPPSRKTKTRPFLCAEGSIRSILMR